MGLISTTDSYEEATPPSTNKGKQVDARAHVVRSVHQNTKNVQINGSILFRPCIEDAMVRKLKGGAGPETDTCSPRTGDYQVWSTKHNLQFPVRVQSTFDYNDRVTGYVVFVGHQSVKKPGADITSAPCIHFLVPPQRHPDERLSFIPTDLCTLERLDYDSGCSLKRAMMQGGDTARMVILALSFLRVTFPWVRRVQLTDTSTIDCIVDGQSGTQSVFPVSLLDISLSTTGMTWYERTFKAVVKDPQLHTAYRSSVNDVLKTRKLMLSLGSDHTAVKHLTDLGCRHDDTFVTFMKRLYGTTRSNNVHPFCSMMQAWGSAMLQRFLGPIYDQIRSVRWVIDLGSKYGVDDTRVRGQDVFQLSPGDGIAVPQQAVEGGAVRGVKRSPHVTIRITNALAGQTHNLGHWRMYA